VYDKDFRFFLISAQKIYNLLVKPFAMTFVCLFFPSDLESNITGINEDLKNFESRLKFASEIQSFAEVGCNATLKINFTAHTFKCKKVKNDHRSKFSNLSNWKEEAQCVAS